MTAILDEVLGRGIPADSIVLMVSDPFLPAELILYEICTSRITYYVVTERHPERVSAEISSFAAASGGMKEEVHIVDARGRNVKIVADVLLEAKDANVIIDTFSPFVDDDILIENMMNACASHNGLWIFLFVPRGACDEKHMSRLSYLCDVFVDMRAERVGDDIIMKIAAPKVRGGNPSTRYVRLRFSSSSVEVDTSRDIV